MLFRFSTEYRIACVHEQKREATPKKEEEKNTNNTVVCTQFKMHCAVSSSISVSIACSLSIAFVLLSSLPP